MKRLCRLLSAGFWANVNPAVPHPRWSQARETAYSTSTSGQSLIPTVCGGGDGSGCGLYIALNSGGRAYRLPAELAASRASCSWHELALGDTLEA